MTIDRNRHAFTTPALLSAAATALLQACSSTPIAEPKTTPVVQATTTAPDTRAATPGASTTPAPESTVRTVTLPPYLDPNNQLSTARSVFFDFDTFAIRSDDTAVIERHGKFLAANPAVAIKIEGSSDERGSVEYNLALGQKRAQAVLGALKVYGVKDTQMEAISWGEEKPQAAGHDEAAWSQNRRADLRYPGEVNGCWKQLLKQLLDDG